MKYPDELLKEEINLKNDECCIVFDFSCYFPYSNADVLTFEFALGMEELNDYKINHRYPNKGYQTISRKYGRKVSKTGYPYIMKLSEQPHILLKIKIGIREKCISLLFPIITTMTTNNPICDLSFRYMFDDNEFYFLSHEKADGLGHYQHYWRSHPSKNKINTKNEMLLNPPEQLDHWLIYDNFIQPYPYTIEDFIQ